MMNNIEESHSAGVALENGFATNAIIDTDIVKQQQEHDDDELRKTENNLNALKIDTSNTSQPMTPQSSIESETNGQTIKNDMICETVTSHEKQRICLVENAFDDTETYEVAKSFNVPIISSDNVTEIVGDINWTTYFVMNNFDGPIFDMVRKSKHRIYGPPALKQVADSKNGLVYVNRPIYNFAMKGVITCFTGIRKKDELTRLVNLIHSMGGSIRKELNSKVTHLICNSSSGDKYQYAMTFRLTVIRADWVSAAWENRDDPNFSATNKSFTDNHRLRAFEAQRICFYGFPPEEHEHMIEILETNGGVPTTIDDPDCTHVIVSNSADRMPDLTGATSPTIIHLPSTSTLITTAPMTTIDKFSPPDGLEKMNLNDNNKSIQSIIVTPKKTKKINNEICDGTILPGNDEHAFLEPGNISPILHNIEEEEECDANGDPDEQMSKRKRDSFDNISIISTDSFAPVFNSAKKPKLIRTGSITRSLRRSMSFVALKNPISMMRTRRNSIDPNASLNSVTSMESTFSETIKRPVKEKLQNFRDRFMKNGNRSKREFCLTPKAIRKYNEENDENDKFISPDEINIVSCKKLNSTMIDTSSTAQPIDSNGIDAKPQTIDGNDEEPDNVNSTAILTNRTIAMNSTAINADSGSTSTTDQQHKTDFKNSKTHIVKSEWFWYTIQNGYADEMDYLFGDYLESIAQTPGTDRKESLPMSLNRRKRKRFSFRNATDSILGGSGKRRSSVSDAGLSISGSFLDYTASPIKHDTKDADTSAEHTPKNKSMRYNHFMDLYNTESNYVSILHTIVSLFQKPLEEMADSNDPLINKSEVRSIFNNFSPIHEVHLQMLNHFRELQSNWSENCSIGKIILDHKDALVKAYPPYVNYFEQMKEALQQCDSQNPRFHAFLKINQAKPECGRQTLQDLMIRPVQRLPSISLLINDILKHTNKSNPDHKELENALKAIKEVMTYINEDKRKTEARVVLFEIYNEIDHCSADLISSERSFISKCEVTELSDCLSGRDDSLMIFLFTDFIEICKIRKSRGMNNMKSPTGTMNALNTTTRGQSNSNKPYKHIRRIALSSIPCVFDIIDSPQAFAITVKDKLFCFNIGEETEKSVYLKIFCKQLALNRCMTDAELFLRSCESLELGIDISDINYGTLKKIYIHARNRLKVSRAFSFKSTPLKLKRAVSTTSPLYGSTNSLTPSSRLTQMKLASCSNINEMGEDVVDDKNNSSQNNNQRDILLAPNTVQPTRKAKSSTLSIAALRRL